MILLLDPMALPNPSANRPNHCLITPNSPQSHYPEIHIDPISTTPTNPPPIPSAEFIKLTQLHLRRTVRRRDNGDIYALARPGP
jgi:hypothetical protein